MTQKTDLNITPYYDDYSEDKKFHKVLFRAGRPLQARELTQSQSILQDQVERFGDHFFKEGSIVAGAESNIDMDVYFIKVKADNPTQAGDDSVESYRTSFHGKFLQGQTTGVVVKVLTSAAATSTDSATLICKQYTQGTDAKGSFLVGGDEVLKEVTITENTGAITINASNNNHFKSVSESDTPSGRASIAEIQDGVIFTRGFFVLVDKQIIILEKYSGVPSYRVGVQIVESLVSSSADASLNDNAQGTNNANAPGADRLKIDLNFKKIALTDTTDINFIELGRVNNGIIELEINRPIYSQIEDTLARRTFDANGDFVVRPFKTSFREHLKTTLNRGFYTQSNGGDESKFVCQISPGKAYVRGYEIEKIGTTNLEISKARQTAKLENASTPVRLGNELLVNNAKALPEISDSSTTDAYKPVKLYDVGQNAGDLDTAAKHIGFSRVRHIENKTNVSSQASDEIQLFLFDVKMFTQLNIPVSSGEFLAGDKVIGSSSSATGIVAYSDSSNNYVMIHDVVGTFTTSDQLEVKGLGTYSGTNTITSTQSFNVGQTRCVFQATPGSGSQNFIADVVLDDLRELSGILSFATNSGSVTGVGTSFTTELQIGDQILDSLGGQHKVSAITNDFAMTITQLDGSAISSLTSQTQVKVVRKRAKLKNQDQSAAIFAWPRDYVDSISPLSNGVQTRRQIVLSVDSSGKITIPINGSTEKFSVKSNDNYQFAVITQSSSGSRTLNNGDIIYPDDISSSDFASTSDVPLEVTLGDANDNAAQILVSYAVTTKTPSVKPKTLNDYRAIKFSSADSGSVEYGCAYNHKELSLGVSDVHKVHAVLEAVPGTTSGSQSNATPPNFIPTETSGSLVSGEIIIGQTSGAKAKLIDFASSGTKTHFVYLETEATFSNGEAIVGQESSAVATIASVDIGSPNIKNRYFVDNGQRDGYYDASKLQLKSGHVTPNNPITVIFDYFEPSGNGQYFAVNSYQNQIDYKDIPNYSPNKVDLGGFEPDGQFELSDAVDFRPHVNDIQAPSTGEYNQDSVTDMSSISTQPFAYESRVFSLKELNTPIPNTTVDATIDFYVPRIDKIFLHKSGKFELVNGYSDISPQRPDALPEAIEMFELFIPAFTENLKEIAVKQKDHRRFTMKDIGRINQRVTNLERVTALSLLEQDTQSKQILDADGFDRFKSGFLVDNFRGHKIGDVSHPDYHVAIDTKRGQLRPQHFTNFFDIDLNTSKSTNFVKTGDLITLPFTELSYVNQNKASRAVNVNPYHVFSFVGDIKLTPSVDLWQDTENLPEVRINREGNFDAVVAENQNSLGTVWNAWQTTWVGEPEVVDTETISSVEGGSWDGDPSQGGNFAPNNLTTITREVTNTPETQVRSGITTSVVEEFTETRNDRVVSVSVIPFIRSRTIAIDANNLKPNTAHYVYFDGIRVDEYVTPHSATYSADSNADVISTVITDSNGRLRANFEIPNNPKQRFPTGERQLRITSSSNNLSNPPSVANTIYQATGTLQSNQTEIVSTRNGRVISESTSGERQFTRRGENINVSTQEIPQPEPIVPPEQPPFVSAREIPPIDIPAPTPVTTPIVPLLVEPLPVDDVERSTEDVFGQNRRFGFRFMREFGWGDPLAQSFLVESNGGMFLSSIDVFFKTKDKALPVSLQIRNMVNGYPGQVILPFSDTVKMPGDVNISADGSSATTFQFESPVYLEDGQEYCFVLYSNSNEYEAFISRMGEPDIISGETISGQPYAGSLFMSQNASTWTAEQTDDLKFNIKQCNFDDSQVSNLVFENADLPSIKLQENPIQTFSGQTYIRVLNYSHGHYSTNSRVTLSGVAGDKKSGVIKLQTPSAISGAVTAQTYETGGSNEAAVTGGSGSGLKVKLVVDSSDTDAVNSISITDPGVGYATGNTITVTIDSQTFTVDVESVEDTLGGIPVSAINSAHTALVDYGIDSFTIDLNTLLDGASYELDSGFSATASTNGGGENVTSTRNLYYDAIHTMIPNIKPQDTEIFASMNRTGTASPESTQDAQYVKRTTSNFVRLNDNVYFSTPSVVASVPNESSNMGGIKSFETRLQLRSINPNVSPVIDVNTIGALSIMNRINNIDSSSDVHTGETHVKMTEPDGDNNAMVYVTRKVTLKTPATTLKVLADNFRPPNSDLKLMYKILKSDEETPIDDLGFEFFNETSTYGANPGNADIDTPRDARNFKEYEYTADNLPEFSSFVIKIVGQSSNTSVVPIVSSLRVLALA